MKIERLRIRHVRVPLKRPFRTAETTRTESDNIIVEAALTDGTRGFGEGVPREYVTGETVTTCFEFLQAEGHKWLGFEAADFNEAVERIAEMGFGDDPVQPQCAARAALETALLDAAGRHFGVPLYRLVQALPDFAPIAAERREVRYGVVLSAGTGALKAWLYRLYGFSDAKLKLGLDPDTDVASAARVRKFLGAKVDLRVDANGGWSIKEAQRIMKQLARLGVSMVEDPLPSSDRLGLAELRARTKLPVMLDDALISERDAHLALHGKLADAFNLRISKNGGLIPVLRLAKLARDAGLDVQLGCHPGETGILSAAGRALACSVSTWRYLEGSYDRHVLKRNVTREDITFGRGGRAARLEGPGLGVTVDDAKLGALRAETLDID